MPHDWLLLCSNRLWFCCDLIGVSVGCEHSERLWVEVSDKVVYSTAARRLAIGVPTVGSRYVITQCVTELQELWPVFVGFVVIVVSYLLNPRKPYEGSSILNLRQLSRHKARTRHRRQMVGVLQFLKSKGVGKRRVMDKTRSESRRYRVADRLVVKAVRMVRQVGTESRNNNHLREVLY